MWVSAASAAATSVACEGELIQRVATFPVTGMELHEDITYARGRAPLGGWCRDGRYYSRNFITPQRDGWW